MIDSKNQDLLTKIISEDTPDQFDQLVTLFNLNHTKKQMVRTLTYDQLLDHVMQQMQERVTKRADQFSNKDLLDYLNTMNSAMEKAQKQIQDINTTPMIQFNQQNNIVNVTDNSDSETLDRESRKRVLDAVSSILAKIKNSNDVNEISSDMVFINNDTSDNSELDCDNSDINNLNENFNDEYEEI